MIFSKIAKQKNCKFFLLIFINFIFYSLQIISGPCCSKDSTKVKNTSFDDILESEVTSLIDTNNEAKGSSVGHIADSAGSNTQVHTSQNSTSVNSSNATAKQNN